LSFYIIEKFESNVTLQDFYDFDNAKFNLKMFKQKLELIL